MRKRWMAAATVLVLAAGVGLAIWARAPAGSAAAAGKGDDTAPGAKAPLEFTAAEVVRPRRASMPAQITLSGPLIAPSTAVVRSRTTGTLLGLSVAEGSPVAAGQVLGRIDAAETEGRVAERVALFESARAQLGQAERTHASNQRLADQQFISPIALETSRSALDAAQAQVRAAQAALDSTRAGARESTLLAPIAGVVHKRHVLPGEKLGFEQPVLTIVDLSQLELAAGVGTHEVSMLQPGMPVRLRVEGNAAEVEGRLARVAPAAEAGTRAIAVTVAVPNPRQALRAGQYAMGSVDIDDAVQRLTLPASAVLGSPGQEQVWVIEAGALVRRSVTLGRRDERAGRVEIVQGLAPQAQVLAARFDNLREGQRALVAGAAGVASAAASSPTLR
jgi:membrane fusion protein (multidrug efflux system)